MQYLDALDKHLALVLRTPRSASRETPLEEDIIVGRNPVLEALRAEMPSRKVLMARGIDIDDRVREIVELAREKKIPIEECARRELDTYPAHQGIALRISPYVYKEFDDVRGKVEGVPRTFAAFSVSVFLSFDVIAAFPDLTNSAIIAKPSGTAKSLSIAAAKSFEILSSGF